MASITKDLGGFTRRTINSDRVDRQWNSNEFVVVWQEMLVEPPIDVESTFDYPSESIDHMDRS